MLDPAEDEVLTFGESRPRVPLAVRVRRHPWLAGAAVAVVILGGAFVVHERTRPGPPLPTVATARVVPPNPESANTTTWEPAADGRPVGPPQVPVQAVLAFGDVPPGGARVTGLAGPGITQATSTSTSVTPEDLRLDTTLGTTLDCAALALPVRPDAYGLAVTTASGGRTRSGVVPAPAVTRAWAATATASCGSWLAAHDLTVTAATGTADPVLPRAEIAFTVTNRGTHDAVAQLDPESAGTTLTPAGPARIPAGAAVRMTAHVQAPCDNVIGQVWDDTAQQDTWSALGLVAMAGATHADVGVPWATGTGAIGIPFDAEPGRTVRTAMETACGGLTPFAALVADHGVHYDKAGRRLTIDLQIDGAPGKVRDVTMTTARQDDPHGFTPLFGSTQRLTPDRTGQSTVTVRYRAPTGNLCSRGYILLPGFSLTARVPVPGGLRVVRFRDFSVPWQDSVILAAVCPGSGQT